MINKNIIGYELVKNVVKAEGYERCGYDKLFVVRKDCGGDYLKGLCEVRENTDENRRALEAKYGIEKWDISNDDYIMWGGTIVYDLSSDEPKDEIMFYWS